MSSSVNLDMFIISLMLFSALILMFVFSVLRVYLLKGNKTYKKTYTALLINSDQMIEMKIPINEQKQTLIEHYSIPIQTETLYSSDDMNQDYYRSILSMNEIPYFPVRETIFQKDSRFQSQMIIGLKKENYSNKNHISDV